MSFLWDVYISHAADDDARVRGIADVLRRAGLRVWLREDEIRPGDDIFARSEHGIEQSRVMALCITRSALRDEWTNLERGTAIFRDPQNSRRRFIPILLEDCVLPDTIKKYDAIRITAGEDRSAHIQRLVSACQDVDAGPDAPARQTFFPVESKHIHTSWISAMISTSEHERLLTAGANGVLGLWALGDDRAPRLLTHVPVGKDRPLVATHKNIAVVCASRKSVHILEDWHTARLSESLLSRATAVPLPAEAQPTAIALSADGVTILVGDARGYIWTYWIGLSRTFTRASEPAHRDIVTSLSCSGGAQFVSASRDSSMCVWTISPGYITRVTTLTTASSVESVAISGDGELALSGGQDAAVRLWDLKARRCSAVLEGHSGCVETIALSPDARLAMSSASTRQADGTRIWDLRTGDCLFYLKDGFGSGLFLDGRDDTPRIVVGTRDGRVIQGRVLLHPSGRSVRYTNAKVVLMGETGVGKTGLMNRLERDLYVPSSSTHGMRFCRISLPAKPEHDKDPVEIEREAWLWDLAGQDDYRLIHQLFLDDTAVALVVINPQGDDPFVRVNEWLKALRTATRQARHTPACILVAGRVDVGGMKISDQKIRRLCKSYGLVDYIQTSAFTGQHCSDSTADGASKLKQLISQVIPWSHLPWIRTDRLLRGVKNKVIDIASRGTALIRVSELCQHVETEFPRERVEAVDVEKAVQLLATQGMILPLKFGQLILLRPTLMNQYSSAVIRAARNHRDQIGCVREQAVIDGDIDMTGVERLDEADEPLLLRAMIQLFLERSLCMMEEDIGRMLVFPSQFRRDRPITEHPEIIIAYSLAGELSMIFTTLVVRLWYSGNFEKKEIWQNAVEFGARGGSIIGFTMDRTDEGVGQINIFAEETVSLEQKVVFIEFVHQHLRRNAIEITRARRYVCGDCRRLVSDLAAVQFRLERGDAFIRCAYCDHKIPLQDEFERRSRSEEIARRIQDLDAQATRELEERALAQALVGHLMAICLEANLLFRPIRGSGGVDGEIIFRADDDAGREARVYVVFARKTGGLLCTAREPGGGDDAMPVVASEAGREASRGWALLRGEVYLVRRGHAESEYQWMNISKMLPVPAAQWPFTGERLDAFTLLRKQDLLARAVDEPA